MHHHDHSAWSQWLTMTPYGPSDLSWSYWSYDYSSSFHVHLRPLYRHHPNDHHSLGCISLKRRPAVEGLHDDMLPTAPVLEPLLKGHSFQQSSSLNVNPLHCPFLWKNKSIYSLTCSTCFEMFFWFLFLCWSLCFFYVGGLATPTILKRTNILMKPLKAGKFMTSCPSGTNPILVHIYNTDHHKNQPNTSKICHTCGSRAPLAVSALPLPSEMHAPKNGSYPREILELHKVLKKKQVNFPRRFKGCPFHI